RRRLPSASPPEKASIPLSVDVALQRRSIVNGEPPAALGDYSSTFEDREEPAGGLARGAGELGEVGLSRRDQDVRVARALRPRRLDELDEHRSDATLNGLERLTREPLVG